MSPGLPWSWGLHRSLDFKEKGRKQSEGPERQTWGGGEEIKRQSEEPEKQETVGWGGAQADDTTSTHAYPSCVHSPVPSPQTPGSGLPAAGPGPR